MQHVRIGIYSSIFLVAASLAFADAVIKKFNLYPGYNQVTVTWETGDESKIKGYEIQRGVSATALNRVAYVTAKKTPGQSHKYEYVDKTVFKLTTAGGRTYYYRIKTEFTDGSSNLSKVESVSPTISSARQTWGSIKAMFR